MKKVYDHCSKCDCGQKRLIVNKKYYLCDEKNYIRINGRPKGSIRESFKARSTDKKSPKVDVSQLKRKYSIKKVSNVKKYRCSNGDTVSQSEIQRRYAITLDAIKLEREPVCQGTGKTDFPLSPSHTISQKRCKDLGKADLIWHPGNIEIEGHHEPSSNPVAAHNIWEVGTLDQKKSLLNWDRKIEFIRVHDPEQYRKLILD